MDSSRGPNNYEDPNQLSDDNDDEDEFGLSFNNIVVDELGSDLNESLKFDYNSSTEKKSTKWAESH